MEIEGFPVRIISRSTVETEEIGFKLGTFLKSPAGAGTVMLYGDLGAGKTTLIKGIASAFGIEKRDVGSASYVMVAEYETSPPFYHIDLYRLESYAAVDAAGIWEYIDTGGVAVIEWAERLSGEPDKAVTVRISHVAENKREIVMDGVDCEAAVCMDDDGED